MLTHKQAAFVREYGVDCDATKAAIRAGYSARSAAQLGYQLLHNPSVAAAVAADQQARTKETRITKDWIVRRGLEALEAAEKDGAHAAVTANLTLVAKLHGYLIDRKDVRQIKSVTDLTDEELDALIERGAG